MSPDPNNPYAKEVGFQEDEPEDIITITTRPLEAAFDTEGDEVIELHEQKQQTYQEKAVDERIILKPEEGGILTVEDILKDTGAYHPEDEDTDT
jgi:hypothetical protein